MNDLHGCFVGEPVWQAGRQGMPAVAIKDNIDMAGLPTRAGLGGAGLGGPGLGGPGRVAAADAPVVARLREAGFTLVGKARMDEAAFGATGDTPHHGRTDNPAAPGHSPGGSSSGSAAAIAARLCDAALGTDTLGSVRIPASYCGIVGLKPTRGLLPMDGVVPLSETLDHVGILGCDVAAVAAVLAVFAPRPMGASNGPLRVGVAAVDADPAVRESCEAALRAVGWTLATCTIPGGPALRQAALLVVEAEGAEAHPDWLDADPAVLSLRLRGMLAYGRDCGSGRLLRALRVLRRATAGLDQVLAGFDLLALPTTPSAAYRWSDGPPPDQAALTTLANAGGHPAISVPVRPLPDGRPVGLQLIGRHGADWAVLAAAGQITAALRSRSTAAGS